jgi:hypothetical protein
MNEKEININQQNQPLGNYQATQYTFTEGFFYSGYIWNASTQNNLNIQITLWKGNVLPQIIIPPNSKLNIKNLPIFIMNINAGYYTFSFLGSTIKAGEPELDLENNTLTISSQPVQVVLYSGTLTGAIGMSVNLAQYLSFYGYPAQRLKEKISFTLHVTSICSGCSMIMYVYGIDANNNILTNAPLGSSNTITRPTDEIINLDLYGFNNVNNLYIVLNIYGSSNPSVTFDLCLMA